MKRRKIELDIFLSHAHNPLKQKLIKVSWKTHILQRRDESEPHKQNPNLHRPVGLGWERIIAFVTSYRALLGMFLVHRHGLYSVLECRGQYLRRLKFRCVPPYDAFLLQTYIYFVVQHLNIILCFA